jgi:hypothetical protein
MKLLDEAISAFNKDRNIRPTAAYLLSSAAGREKFFDLFGIAD